MLSMLAGIGIRLLALILGAGIGFGCHTIASSLLGAQKRVPEFAIVGSTRLWLGSSRFRDITICRSQSGSEVTVAMEFDTPDNVAQAELDALLAGNVDVVDRVPVLTDDGECVGTRVVAVADIPYVGGRRAFIYKRHSGYVHIVQGARLDEVTALEAMLK